MLGINWKSGNIFTCFEKRSQPILLCALRDVWNVKSSIALIKKVNDFQNRTYTTADIGYDFHVFWKKDHTQFCVARWETFEKSKLKRCEWQSNFLFAQWSNYFLFAQWSICFRDLTRTWLFTLTDRFINGLKRIVFTAF